MSALEKQIHKKHFKNARLILFSQEKTFDTVGIDLLKELRDKYKPKKGLVNKKVLLENLRNMKMNKEWSKGSPYSDGMREGIAAAIRFVKQFPCDEV